MTKLSVVFFRTEQGHEPVREWLRDLSKEVRYEIGSDIKRAQEDWPDSNRKPLVDSFGGGLYEVRTKVDRNQYRVLFCMEQGTMVLLHGFMKKTQTTPAADLELARARKRQVQGKEKTR